MAVLLAKRVITKQMDVIMGLGRQTLTKFPTEELLWKPSNTSWSVSRTTQGWVADWAEPEPEGLGPPSLAWQLWHANWWLSMVLDHSFGSRSLTRETFDWEGPDRGFAAIDELYARLVAALEAMDDQEWHASERTRWPYLDGRPFGMVVGWASMELTKNIAEMARARSYFAAAQSSL